jgi:hypothetical protein
LPLEIGTSVFLANLATYTGILVYGYMETIPALRPSQTSSDFQVPSITALGRTTSSLSQLLVIAVSYAFAAK